MPEHNMKFSKNVWKSYKNIRKTWICFEKHQNSLDFLKNIYMPEHIYAGAFTEFSKFSKNIYNQEHIYGGASL